MWRCRSPLSSITRCRYRAVVGEKIGENVCSVAPTPDSWGRSSKKKTPFITFVLGGPGTGKGTQCEKIAECFGFTHLSAGELIRREISSNSENGLLKTITDGKIVPSDVTVKLIQREMRSSNNYKFLIDGFPRSEENRIAFERFVGLEPDIVLFFDCPEEEMVQRVLSRNQGRADDNIETIKKRLHVFFSLNLPVVEYYASKGKLRKINAVGTVDEIFKQVHPIFAAFEDENHGLIQQKQARGYLFESSSWRFAVS